MSQVKRYTESLRGGLTESATGDWVSHEDYAAMEQRAEAVEAKLALVRAQRDLAIDLSDKSEADKAELYAELYRLREEIKGPDGFDTWKDAAVYLKASKTNMATKRIDYLTAMAAHHSDEWHKMGPITGYMKGWNSCLAETRPAPAINLADLVPDEKGSPLGTMDYDICHNDGWNECRAAILRNIEEANGQTIPAAKVGSVADTEVQAGSEEASDEGESK